MRGPIVFHRVLDRLFDRIRESSVRSRIAGSALLLVIAAATAGRALADEPTRVRDVVYGRKAGMALTLDVLRPAAPNGIGVIFLVSGGFSSDIAWVDSGFLRSSLFRKFTDRGQTVFLVCHGAQPKFTVPEIVADIHRAVRFIRVHASDHGVDPNRLGISGASSGGFLSLTIGTMGKAGDPAAKDPIDRASSAVQAVACFFPPADLVDYGRKDRTMLEYEPVKFVWHAFGAEGKSREEQVALLRELSPYSAITASTAPTLIIHGDQDVLVPHEQSERFAARLEELKVPHRLDIRKGAGHGWEGLDEDCALLAAWFEERMPPAKAGDAKRDS